MAMTLSYSKILDDIKPSLEALGEVVYGAEVPITHLLSIVENLNLIELKSKAFWSTRDKILSSFIEKDEKGLPKTELVKENVEFVITDKNKILWKKKYEELRNEQVEIDLKKIKQEYLAGVKITANQLRGCYILLE